MPNNYEAAEGHGGLDSLVQEGQFAKGMIPDATAAIASRYQRRERRILCYGMERLTSNRQNLPLSRTRAIARQDLQLPANASPGEVQPYLAYRPALSPRFGISSSP